MALHDLVLARFGGAEGIRDRGALDAALARPWLGFGGQCVASTSSERAAYVMDGVISSHPFVDGNKRTGVALAGLVLHKEGYELKLERGVLHDLAMGLATHALGIDHVAAGLERGMTARRLELTAERVGERAPTRGRGGPSR
jgi:death-on-curing protein